MKAMRPRAHFVYGHFHSVDQVTIYSAIWLRHIMVNCSIKHYALVGLYLCIALKRVIYYFSTMECSGGKTCLRRQEISAFLQTVCTVCTFCHPSVVIPPYSERTFSQFVWSGFSHTHSNVSWAILTQIHFIHVLNLIGRFLDLNKHFYIVH